MRERIFNIGIGIAWAIIAIIILVGSVMPSKFFVAMMAIIIALESFGDSFDLEVRVREKKANKEARD